MKTFKECCEYLGISEELPKCNIDEKKLQAIYKLRVCMEAWNRQDKFELDEMASWNGDNVGYTPYFLLRDGKLLSPGNAHFGSSAGIVYVNASLSATIVYASIGLRICLVTRDRAIEFGEAFIKIFNELI